jgi:hypothetical protein
MKPTEFHETIGKLLELKLKPMIGADKDLNLVACVEIYTTIFETMVTLLTESGIPITNEAMNYLSQQYYDGVLVNGRQELDPEIFTQRAKLSEIETKELALLAMMLRGTDFMYPVVEEIKKRS